MTCRGDKKAGMTNEANAATDRLRAGMTEPQPRTPQVSNDPRPKMGNALKTQTKFYIQTIFATFQAKTGNSGIFIQKNAFSEKIQTIAPILQRGYIAEKRYR